MSFAKNIWNIERFIRHTSCKKCMSYYYDHDTGFMTCPIFGEITEDSNCVYYRKK